MGRPKASHPDTVSPKHGQLVTTMSKLRTIGIRRLPFSLAGLKT